LYFDILVIARTHATAGNSRAVSARLKERLANPEFLPLPERDENSRAAPTVILYDRW
jgi:hypothetical protein